ncbi:hypothetical protein PIB30_089136 [Stylosanthes scabra]|uniref:Uncharacterized protein n=1 Tax=Stylosanthes scabra TaxID=79078 RepID=A0ABU6RUC9_9FABA|nr:hypothetical protein [Stylosanthes scabra]
MARIKQVVRCTRVERGAPPPPPRLSQMPVNRWFENDNERDAYDEQLSMMEILPPKYIGEGVLPEKKYPEFWRLIDIQGLRPFLFMIKRYVTFHCYCQFNVNKYHPRFVAAAYTTISIRDNLNSEGRGSFWFGFRLGGRTYQFPLSVLATAWGLENKGAMSKGGSIPHRSWGEFDKLKAMRELRLEMSASGKYVIRRMSTDHCLLLYVLSYILLPRKRNQSTVNEEDRLILWAMAKGKQIHWPYLLANQMLKFSQGTVDSYLRHAHLWTKIFEAAGIDMSREKAETPDKANVITTKNINLMRRNTVNQANEADDAGKDVVAEDVHMVDVQPQVEVGPSPQVPPEVEVLPPVQQVIKEFIQVGFEGMRDMVTEGFARLSNRLDNLDTRMASLQDEFRSFRGKDTSADNLKQLDGATARGQSF